MFGHLLLKLGGDRHTCNMEGGERAGACPWLGGGARGHRPPPLEIGKKDAVRGNFNLFLLCFTNEIRGESIHYTCKMEGWADRRVSIVGGGERGPCPPPPLEMGKKMLSEEILTSFTYVFLMIFRGIDIHCIHAKWKGVGGQALVYGGRGWGPCPPP